MAKDMENKQNVVPTAEEQANEQSTQAALPAQETQETQQLTFSVANNRQSKRWRTVQYTWDEFCEKVSHTTRTVETVAQYALMKKKNRDDIKDVGGYVAGKLKNGRRKKETVVFRSCLTLDMDYGDPDMDLEGYLSMLLGCRAVIYSTHTHRPESPRYRIVIPLSRDVSPDEYTAIARKVAADIDIELFDDTTYEAHRLMYWPSTSSDGEFYYRKLDGEVLDADEILSSYEDWRDVSSWPVSERQNKIEAHRLKKQQDPLEKPGLIGAFCRAYFPIDEAISEFLSDLYQPCDGSAPSTIDGSVTRYDYIPADSSAGALVYGGKYMYSHHATDPACNQLLNAFDLVRIHKFGDLDNRLKDGVIDADTDQSDPANEASVMKLPSYKKMVEFASNLKDVKAQLAQERIEKAQQDFSPIEDEEVTEGGSQSDGSSADGNPPDDTDSDNSIDSDDTDDSTPDDDVSWQLNLELTKNGTIKDTLDNIVIIMENDSRLKPISYNLHRSGIDARSPLPWEQVKPGWNDSDASALKVYLNRYYGIYAPTKTKDALLAVTAKRAYHPIRDYFASLPDWDGTKRVETLFIDYLGAEDTPYTRAVTRKALAAAVARIFEPGIKFDSVLILIGPQGIGKSTLFARLGGEWFSDSLTLTDMRDKSGAEKMQGYWI
ncbi:MAG: virulence-associated E family protein, partial [Clostridiales bacterium]|nr:virulence-associated E family protein [Clostridiales bacterium]